MKNESRGGIIYKNIESSLPSNMITKLHRNKRGGINSVGKMNMISKDELLEYPTFLSRIVHKRILSFFRNFVLSLVFPFFFFASSALSPSLAIVPFSFFTCVRERLSERDYC